MTVKVVVSGSKGAMGQEVVKAVTADTDLDVIACVDPSYATNDKNSPSSVACFATLSDALDAVEADVIVDFTAPAVVAENVAIAMSHNIDCVVGTTGLSTAQLQSLSDLSGEETCLFYAPNFAIGAVLMMDFAQKAAKFMSHVEIIEFHHDNKKDAPSGTALKTAEKIAHARKNTPRVPGRETETEEGQGARGALVDDVTIHSVRLPGFVASQEVIFGSHGQTLTLRHDSTDRSSFMPGVVLAIKSVKHCRGLIVGLEKFLD